MQTHTFPLFLRPPPLPLRTFLGFQHIILVNSKHGSNRAITIGHIVLNTNCTQVYVVICMLWQFAPRTIASKLNKTTVKSYIPFHERLVSVCVSYTSKRQCQPCCMFWQCFPGNEQSLIHV